MNVTTDEKFWVELVMAMTIFDSACPLADRTSVWEKLKPLNSLCIGRILSLQHQKHQSLASSL